MERASRWEPTDGEDYEAANAELARRFATWATRRDGVVDPVAPEGLLHYKWAYVDGHLARWTRRDLSEIYLELYPAKVMAVLDQLDDVLDDVLTSAKVFLTFLAETGLLDEESEPVDVLVDHLDQIEAEFRSNMADQSRFSFGKRLWTEAYAEGVRPDDPDAVEAFMERFNARPRAERDAILGGGLKPGPRPDASGRFTPPGTRPRPSSANRRKRRR